MVFNPNQPFDPNDLILALPNNVGLHIMSKEGDTTNLYAERVLPQDLAALARDQSKFHLITLMMRPGSPEFFQAIEWRMYPPTKPNLNQLFEMRYFKWNDVFWTIISVPIKDGDHIRKMAREYEMRVSDGIPFMIGGGCETKFPMAVPGSEQNVFTLEGLGGESYPHITGFSQNSSEKPE